MNNVVTADRQTVGTHPSPFEESVAGARAMIPLVVGAIPFGIIFGTLAATSELSTAAAMAMSALVFAGSSQFIALTLVLGGTSVLLIVATTLVVNLRHLLYAATLLPHVAHLGQRWKLPLAFTLTDEAFAVAVARYQRGDRSTCKHWYHLGAALFLYVNWQLSTLAGLTLGHWIPNAAGWGLDFAMAATFIGMLVPYLAGAPMLATIVVAGVTAVAAHDLPHHLGLMVAALAGIAAGMLCERLQAARGEVCA